MANFTQPQQNSAKTKAKEKKLLLANLFVDAPVRVEPEEPQKVVVAGLTEARPQKNYPDTFFGRATAVFRGELETLLKASIYFIVFTLPFILILGIGYGYFEESVLGGAYNFMGDIGVGFPGGGDSIAQSVASLYWNVDMPIAGFMCCALIFASLGMAGHFYCAKRSYFQDYYRRISRTYWIGFAKYWWKFLVTAIFAVAVGFALSVAIFYLLQQQTLGTEGVGAYCAVVFGFVLGAPLIAICMVMQSLFTSYELSFSQCFKNAIVICVNCPFMIGAVGVLSLAPLLICIASNLLAIIAYVAMAIAGFNFLALNWIAMANRGMTKCHNLKIANEKLAMQAQRRNGATHYQGAKKTAIKQKQLDKSESDKNIYANLTTGEVQKPPKKTTQQNTYKNPKKKKKKQ